LPLGDGRVLVLRSGAGIHRLVLLAPGCPERNVGRIDSRGLRLLASPEPGTMAVASGSSDDGRTALWLIRETSPHVQAVPAPDLPGGTLNGGHWLDRAGRTLGLDHHGGSWSEIVAVDLATGAVTAMPGAGEGDHHLLMSQPRAGRFLAARNAGGQVSFGWGQWDGAGWRLEFPEALGSFDGVVTPLAIDPAGRRVAICVEKGLRSELQVREPGQPGPGQREAVSIPPGVLWPAARWTPGGLHLVTSGPQRPANVTTITPNGRPLTSHDPAPPGGWAAAHAEVLAGPAGPIEAVIYGGPGWRDAERLLVALHGGPHAAWKLNFEPVLQDLAVAGVAIVAPNQRGSTGYGPAHRDAIRGAWGGPDLEDFLEIGTSLCAYRSGRGLAPPGLFGVSYGAFLALLAAAAEPSLWSCCAAVAPFCSAGSLYADGPESVRSFLRRLGALDVVQDALGPRDLERLAGRIIARLLIVHGIADETIPASQPRRIVAALERAGRRRGAEFIYREVPGGYDSFRGTGDEVSRRLVRQFLAGPADADPALGDRSAQLIRRSS
jgi:pimeloyl-ACP methyl ester carboxylesterase